MSRYGKHSPVRGFTLIEVVLALTLMGLLTATTVAAWRIGVNSQEKVARTAEMSRRDSSVGDFVMAQIGAIVPMHVRAVGGRGGLTFAGTPSSMLLVSRYSLAQRTRAGLVLAIYKVVKDEERERLMYSERRISSQQELDQALSLGIFESQNSSANGSDGDWMTMLDHVSGGHFMYFGKAQTDKEPKWAPSWEGTSGSLPEGIAFHFSDDREPNHVARTIAAEVNSFENRDRPIPLYLYR